MAKRPLTPQRTARAAKAPAGRAAVRHYSLYLPAGVHEALREAAFHERVKIHDIIMQGIDMALKKRGYPSMDELKAQSAASGGRRAPRKPAR